MVGQPPLAAAITKGDVDMGWLGGLVLNPAETTVAKGPKPRISKVADRQQEICEGPLQSFFRFTSVVNRVPAQYGERNTTQGWYAASENPDILNSAAPFVNSSQFQPISRSAEIRLDMTEMARIGGPAAAARQYGNTALGMSFLAFKVGQVLAQYMQSPRPAFKSVLPSMQGSRLPSVIGNLRIGGTNG